MNRELGPPDEYDTSDQYTTLEWRFTEHWSGEWAVFEVCGLRAYVRDYDGDSSAWSVRRGRRGSVIASGERWEGNHFFACLRDAEAALRRIVKERIEELRAAKIPYPRASGAVPDGGR